MGVGIVPMVMVVSMRMLMAMVVMMVVMMTVAHRNWDAIGLTDPRAFLFTESTGFRKALNVVMVTGLVKSHFLLKAQHLSPVFAEGAIHCSLSAHHLLNPLQEGV